MPPKAHLKVNGGRDMINIRRVRAVRWPDAFLQGEIETSDVNSAWGDKNIKISEPKDDGKCQH